MKSHLQTTLLLVSGILSSLLLLMAPRAQAQSFPTWNGSTANWSTTGNWTGGNASSYGQLQFSGNGVASTNNDVSGLSQWRFYFSGTKSYTLAGNSVSLFDFSNQHPWLLSDSTVTQTISLNVNFATTSGTAANYGQISARSTGDLVLNTIGITGSQVAQVRVAGESTGKVIFNGAISGTGKQVVIGLKENATAATTTDAVFNAANTYTGDTFVTAGSLSFGSSGNSNSSTIRLGETSGTNAATIKLISATGGQTLTSLLNARSGSSGTLTLDSQNTSGTNTWSGGFFLDKSMTISQAGGGTLALSGGVDVKANIATFQGAGNFDVSSVVSNSAGSGRVTQKGTGILRFGAANTYTNETDIDAGTIRVDVAPSGAGITSTYYVGNGGTTGTAATLLIGGGAGGTSGGLTFGNPVTANVGSSGNRMIGGSNTTGTNTFSGSVTLSDSNATLVAATGGTVSFNTISAAALQTVAIGGGGNNGTVQLSGVSDNINLAATVNSGTLVLNKTSSSTVHSVGGTLAINSGATAQLGGTGGDQIFNSGSITVNAGGTFDANDRNETVTNVSLAGNGVGSAGALVNSGTTFSSVTATGTTTLAADSSIGVTNSGGTLALSGNISGSFGLTKVGAGTLTLTGTNSYGDTTISAGTLQVGNGGSTGTLGTGTVTNNGALVFNRNNSLTVANDISGTGNVTQSGSGTTILTGTNSYGTTTISSGTLQVGNGGSTGTLGTGSVTNNGALVFNRTGNFTVSNGISGAGSVMQNGSNIITLNTTNAYSGATTVNAGTLRVTSNDALGTNASGTTVNSGGALRLFQVNYTTAEALTINGTGVAGNGALYNIGGNSTFAGQVTAATNATIRSDSGALTLTGGVVKNGTTLTITGTGSVVVNGVGISGSAANSDLVVDGGTLVVNTASTYNGPTTVQNGGTLVANSSTGSSTGTGTVTITSGSTLSGAGKIDAGANLVSINGALVVGDTTLGSPTASVLQLKTSGAGSTTLGSTSTLAIDLFSNIGDNTGVASAADMLRLFGVVSVDAAAQLVVTDTTGSMAFNVGDKWKIGDISSATVTGGFSSYSITAPTLTGLKGWEFSSSGGSWFLSVVTIPEPSRALLLMLGTSGLFLRRRRA